MLKQKTFCFSEDIFEAPFSCLRSGRLLNQIIETALQRVGLLVCKHKVPGPFKPGCLNVPGCCLDTGLYVYAAQFVLIDQHTA